MGGGGGVGGVGGCGFDKVVFINQVRSQAVIIPLLTEAMAPSCYPLTEAMVSRKASRGPGDEVVRVELVATPTCRA